jgi:polar amino acid transport system permease protein
MPDTLSSPRPLPLSERLRSLPYWAIVAALLGVLIAWHFMTTQPFDVILTFVLGGLGTTIKVTLIANVLAMGLGLLVSLGRVSHNLFVYHLATFYVEIIRGIPILVLLLFIAFGVVPYLKTQLNLEGEWIINLSLSWLGLPWLALTLADNEIRVIAALTIAYSAFLAEIFRAGIESVERGQIEAGRALGMSGWQVMLHIVLRQAVRRVLPALGNDFIAMLKDSSLVSALGVRDMTRLSINYQSRTFQTVETYAVLAYLYLVMTLLLSLVVKLIERRMARERRDGGNAIA